MSDYGKPWSRIPEHVERLIRRGKIRPPLYRLDESFLKLPRPADPEGDVLAALIGTRREAR